MKNKKSMKNVFVVSFILGIFTTLTLVMGYLSKNTMDKDVKEFKIKE